MASLKQIRAGIATTLATNLSGIAVYKRVPENPVLPCVVVRPALDETADFDVAFGRGTDTWRFDLIVLVGGGDGDIGQDDLDDYVTGDGAKSIREVVHNNRGLGLSNTDAHIAGLSAYGLTYEVVGHDHLGARLRLIAHTRGTE